MKIKRETVGWIIEWRFEDCTDPQMLAFADDMPEAGILQSCGDEAATLFVDKAEARQAIRRSAHWYRAMCSLDDDGGMSCCKLRRIERVGAEINAARAAEQSTEGEQS